MLRPLQGSVEQNQSPPTAPMSEALRIVRSARAKCPVEEGRSCASLLSKEGGIREVPSSQPVSPQEESFCLLCEYPGAEQSIPNKSGRLLPEKRYHDDDFHPI